MPLLWIAITQFLMVVAVPLALRILKALGIGFVAYAGASFAVSQFQTWVFNNFENMPAAMFSIISMAGFDIGIKMVFAAYIARVAVSGATSGGKWTGPWNQPSTGSIQA